MSELEQYRLAVGYWEYWAAHRYEEVHIKVEVVSVKPVDKIELELNISDENSEI